LQVSALSFKNGLKSGNKQRRIKVNNMNTILDEIKQLDISERLQLVEDLWDSVAVRASEFPITEAQKAELDRRLVQHHKEPLRGVSLDQIAQKLGVAI
jgi:putative addiction module component (TIGR02574 family)